MLKRVEIPCRKLLASWPVLGWMLALLLVVSSGCDRGPKLYDVKGTVTVDGSPAGGVNLLFFDTNQAIASASSGPDGTFSISTDMRAGVPEGKYKVTANWPDPNFVPKKASSMGSDGPSAPDLLKGRYGLTKSDLTLDVTSTTKDATLVLTTK